MTREEAIIVLKRDNPNNIAIRNGFENLYEQRNEAFNMAIKALEQEPKIDTLDKIREEISAIAIIEQVDEHTAFVRSSWQVKQVVLDIIDKYRRNDNAKKSIIDRFRDSL